MLLPTIDNYLHIEELEAVAPGHVYSSTPVQSRVTGHSSGQIQSTLSIHKRS